MSMLSAKSSVGISAARLRSGAGAVLELESPVSRASVGSEGTRFLVGCTSRIGPLVSGGSSCGDEIFGDDGKSWVALVVAPGTGPTPALEEDDSAASPPLMLMMARRLERHPPNRFAKI